MSISSLLSDVKASLNVVIGHLTELSHILGLNVNITGVLREFADIYDLIILSTETTHITRPAEGPECLN
jgi:hypothetical protein